MIGKSKAKKGCTIFIEPLADHELPIMVKPFSPFNETLTLCLRMMSIVSDLLEKYNDEFTPLKRV